MKCYIIEGAEKLSIAERLSLNEQLERSGFIYSSDLPNLQKFTFYAEDTENISRLTLPSGCALRRLG